MEELIKCVITEWTIFFSTSIIECPSYMYFNIGKYNISVLQKWMINVLDNTTKIIFYAVSLKQKNEELIPLYELH